MEPLSKKGWVVAHSTFVSEIFHAINVPNQPPGGFLDGYLISTSQKWKGIPHHLLKPFDGVTSGIAVNFFLYTMLADVILLDKILDKREPPLARLCGDGKWRKYIFVFAQYITIDKSKSVLWKPDRTSVITAQLVTLQTMIFASVGVLAAFMQWHVASLASDNTVSNLKSQDITGWGSKDPTI
jgi:hypothetical protein